MADYYCNKCKRRHYSKKGKKYSQHKRYANTGRPKQYKKRVSSEMTKKEKLLYDLSVEISGEDDMDAGDPEPYFKTQPKLRKALRFLIKKGYYNTKEINDALKIVKKHNLGSDALWDLSFQVEDEEYDTLKEWYGINKGEANKLGELVQWLSWFDNYDNLLEKAKKEGWKKNN